MRQTSENLPYERQGDEERCISDLAPFDIPDSWEWCRVGDFFTNISGLSYKKNDLAKISNSMVRVLRGGNIGNEEYIFKPDDVMISSEFVKQELFLKKGWMITPAVSSIEHIGKVGLIEKDYSDVVVGGFVLMLQPFFDNEIISKYFLYAFAAKNHRDNCRNITHKSGQAFYNMSREKLMNLPVPVPPVGEMRRIVSKIEELLPHVKEYGSKETDAELLNNNFPERLKKSILQWAVQGKLVPQDPTDEPASVLLERIREEKARLVKEGKIKKDKNESIIFRRDNSHYEKLGGTEKCIDVEIPYDIPETWSWIRLKDFAYLTSGGQYPEDGSGCLYIKVADMNLPTNENEILTSTRRTNAFPEGNIPTCSIIFPKRGGAISTNKKRMVRSEPICIDSNTMAMTSILPDCFYYLKLWFDGIDLASLQSGTSVPQINNKDLEPLLIPIPPLSEQRMIVSKTRELMSAVEAFI